jgi:hypothetical protein
MTPLQLKAQNALVAVADFGGQLAFDLNAEIVAKSQLIEELMKQLKEAATSTRKHIEERAAIVVELGGERDRLRAALVAIESGKVADGRKGDSLDLRLREFARNVLQSSRSGVDGVDLYDDPEIPHLKTCGTKYPGCDPTCSSPKEIE